ncbi:hypothetical protein ACOSQ3_011160 [Xanthoceras sorbifolium]
MVLLIILLLYFHIKLPENSIAVGSCCFRPAGDHEWSFKPNGGITEIKLRRGLAIDSITFKSIDEKGNIETSNKFGGNGGYDEHVNTEMKMNIDQPQEIGPWGGHTGKPWDDGANFLAINQIDVHVRNGIVLGIKLDSTSEHLVGIMGFYGPIEGNCGFEAVRSVSVYTNKGKYGPFGDEIGIFFSSPVISGKVIGFHGRSGVYLDAIGVYIEYS